MAGAFIVSPYVYLADENGAPLSGGLVYSYAAGSGTLQALYTDSALLIPYPQPIQLDSAGRFAGYALPKSYKIVVTKADGSAWWTQDNYWLAAPTGSGTPATVIAQTSNYTVAAGDVDQVILADATAGPFTVTFYTSVANAGSRIRVIKIDASANTVTVDPFGAQTIDGASTVVLGTQWSQVGVVSDGSNWVLVDAVRFPQTLAKSTDYTVAVVDGDDVFVAVDASGASRTITLYPAVGNKGRRVAVKKIDASANTVTIDGNAAETIDGATTLVLAIRYDHAVLECDGANWHVIAANVVPSMSINQAKFPATQVPSTDANTLDDYEEGSWTPSDVSGAALSFTTVEGRYAKIGQLVVAACTLTYPATANGTAAQIGGLPFTSMTTTNAIFGGSVNYNGSGTAALTVNVPPTGTSFLVYTTAGAQVTNANLTGATMRFTIMYRANA